MIIQPFSEKEPTRYLGGGFHREVIVHPEDSNWVLCKYRHYFANKCIPNEISNENFIKASFYLTKLVHSIFPNNIADIRSACSEPFFEIRQRIIYIDYAKDYVKRKELIDSVLEKTGYRLDTNYKNYLVDQSGNIVYCDVFLPFYSSGIGHGRFDMPKIAVSIDELPNDKKDIATKYLKRLETLTTTA